MKFIYLAAFLAITCSFPRRASAGNNATDDLINSPTEVGEVMRDQRLHPPLAGEDSDDYAKRRKREKAEEAMAQSIKIVVLKPCKWTSADGDIEVTPGQILEAQGTEDGSYVIPYRGSRLMLPLNLARQTPFSEQELAAKRAEIQRMYDSADQRHQLKEQTELLDSIQRNLEQIRQTSAFK